MTITYRDATPDDVPRRSTESFARASATPSRHLYRPAGPRGLPCRASASPTGRRELADPRFAFRIAEVDGEPVGYVKLGPLDACRSKPTGPRCELDQLYVLQGASRRGHRARADGLGDRRGARAAARSELYLTVFIDNHRARRFYDRYGFEDVGRYDFMVGEQADEDIIMRKTL